MHADGVHELTPRAADARLVASVRRRLATRSLSWLWPALLLGVLAFLVLYPVDVLVLGALTHDDPVGDRPRVSGVSLANFVTVLDNEHVHAAVLNSAIACAGGTLVAVVIGLFFSWIVIRTDTPGKRVLATAGILPLFVPPLVAGVAWAILGSPRSGLLNVLLASMGLDWRVNLYSMTGIVAVFGMYYAPYVYMFTSAALSNMDPSLEEAAEISGAGPLRILATVTFPLIAPAILAGTLLSFVVMLGTYGIPAVLGTAGRIAVLTTYIYRLTSWTPPLYNTAAAVAVILLGITAVLVVAQQRLLAGRSFTTVAGKAFRPRTQRLGSWRYLTLALGLLEVLVVVGLPLCALCVAAFRRFLFIRTVSSLFDASAYSLGHFERLFANPLTLRSLVNTMEVGGATALTGGLLAFAIAYTVHRTRLPGRRLLDVVATIPVAIPGLVIGVAYLWSWIGLPIYGTIWILALAFVARFLPDTVKALSTSLMQIHRELEEASWTCGRGVLATIHRIVLPLARPGVFAAMTLLFVLAIRELGSSLFLYTSQNLVMAVLLLNYYEGGDTGVTAAFSLVQVAFLAVLIGTLQWLGRGKTGDVGRAS